MLYLGGKTRSQREIATVILNSTSKRDSYLEPFFGGGSSCITLAPRFSEVRVGDIHEDLCMMWQAVKDGWRAPLHISESEYNQLMTSKPSALRGFAGFACSFGGKWFAGYARDGTNNSRSYAKTQAYRIDQIGSILKLSNAMILNVSYAAWDHKQAVVYCDPPYVSTTSYKHYFDTKRFWKVMDRWSEEGASVFVSEYNAPSHWKCIWEKNVKCKIQDLGRMSNRVERLFYLK